MSDSLLAQRLASLDQAGTAASLTGIMRGIEKESLRVTQTGELAQTPHPEALGAALTHPQITTDYSEALLELITPASADPAAPLTWLDRLHRFIQQDIAQRGELIWNNSMPCPLGSDDSIPVANYGSSNVGRMKHIYRLGLGHRYGRKMQTIAGIHYNFSFPEVFWETWQLQLGDQQLLQDFISQQYFGLLRNFQRHAWLLIYLFGASPAVCASFLDDQPHQLLKGINGTLSRPYATSLRMSDLGYQNNAQSSLQVSLDDIDSYIQTLTYAISTPEPAYEQIGVRNADGRYRQLNPNILQIENEFYSSIRPKRTSHRNERPTLALQRRGVEYIEIRSLDINPLLPLGLDADTCHFLDLFASYCLFSPAPMLSHCDMNSAKQNIRQVVYDGRRPGLTLWRCFDSVPLQSWGLEICTDMEAIAELFDKAYGGEGYRLSLAAQRAKLEHPEITPSAQVLEAISQAGSFTDFALQQAQRQQQAFLANPLPKSDLAFFRDAAQHSLAAQRSLEQQQKTSFDAYLADYFQGIKTLTN